MRESLISTERKIPYFSGGKLIIAKGESYDSNLGGNCVLQNTHLAEVLRTKGGNPSFLRTATGRPHFATTCRDGDLYFLDPCLLLRDPINLSRLLRDKTHLEFGTYPTRGGFQNRIIAEARGERQFSITQVCPVQRTTDLYDLSQARPDITTLDDIDIATIEQRRIILRVLNNLEETGITGLNTSTGSLVVKRFDGTAVSFDLTQDTAQVLAALAEISDHTRVNASVILETLRRSAEIYRQLTAGTQELQVAHA